MSLENTTLNTNIWRSLGGSDHLLYINEQFCEIPLLVCCRLAIVSNVLVEGWFY
eukprot:UN07960